MESVMNFLADYYIWFFVGALVLCFALIGFIIDARKKKKNEFKGEAITEPTNVAPTATTQTTNEPQVVGNTVNVGGEATLGANTNTVSDSTMEINDIPMAPTTQTPETKVEFYSGPVEMPTPEPAPVESAPIAEQPSSVTIGEPISFNSVPTQAPVEPTQTTETPNVTDNTNNPNNNM